MSLFKKKELKLYVVKYSCYGTHCTIIEATDEIQAIRKVRKRAYQGPGMEYPCILGVIPFKETSDSGDRKD